MEWIEWNGIGEPDLLGCIWVECKCKDDYNFTSPVEDTDWNWIGDGSDIAAYRVLEKSHD